MQYFLFPHLKCSMLSTSNSHQADQRLSSVLGGVRESHGDDCPRTVDPGCPRNAGQNIAARKTIGAKLLFFDLMADSLEPQLVPSCRRLHTLAHRCPFNFHFLSLYLGTRCDAWILICTYRITLQPTSTCQQSENSDYYMRTTASMHPESRRKWEEICAYAYADMSVA